MMNRMLVIFAIALALAKPAYGDALSINNNGGSCRYSLEFTVFTGPEPIRATSCTRGLSDNEYVKASYRVWLQREPDPGGYAGWYNFLQGGGSRKDMTRAFLSSAEYKAICKC